MKTIGYFALAVGIIWLIVALNMDTSVSTGYGRVNNIGLMASKQNQIMLGGFIAFCGLMMSIFGKSPQESTVGVVKCPLCAEPINPEAIKCKHCGSDIAGLVEKKEFKVADLPFESFFIRRKTGFDIHDEAVKNLVYKIKKANNEIHPRNLLILYTRDINELKNKLPSSIRDEFETRYKYWLNS
ncbi:zinc ribbon domain-containing protein [Yersinia intermedia]|uniref:zinc ribbon domain-containing protein n=1 Tax=Yersinia intermedia TaxID=631 RepID=UPI0030CF1D2C